MGNQSPVNVEGNRIECVYVPSKVGTYEIDVKYAANPVANSPYRVQVVPHPADSATIEGLPSIGKINVPFRFVVDLHGQASGNVAAEIIDPENQYHKAECLKPANENVPMQWEFTPSKGGK